MTHRHTTPCILACRLEDGVCEGCLRTLAEISSWSRLTYRDMVRTTEEVVLRHPDPDRHRRLMDMLRDSQGV